MIDEHEGSPNESIEDWKKEVRHLIWPTIIVIIVIIVLILLIDHYD